MKRCRNCKAKLDKHARVCPQCGTPVRRMRLRHKLLIALAAFVLVVGGAVGALFATGHGDLITGLPARLGLAPESAQEGASGSGGVPSGGDGSGHDTDFLLLGSAFTDRTISGEDDARAAVADAAPAFGMDDPASELGECAANEVLGNSYYRFTQQYDGIPVYGRSVVVSADGTGAPLSLTSNYAAVGDIETEPTIDAASAEDAAMAEVDGALWTLPEGLTIYSLYDTDPTTAWQVLVVADDGAYRCFVASDTGKVVATETALNTASGKGLDGKTYTFETTPNVGGGYAMVDEGRSITVFDAEGDDRAEIISHIELMGDRGTTLRFIPNPDKDEGGYVWSADGSTRADETNEGAVSSWYITHDDGSTERILGSNYGYFDHLVTSDDNETWDNRAAVSAMDSVVNVYDYYNEVLGWKSYDGAGGPVYVVADLPENNAFAWAPTGEFAHVAAGGSEYFSSRVVVGHEYTHAVVRATCNLSGDKTEDADAFNEAVSDLMGIAATDMGDDGLANNSATWNLDEISRNLEDPVKSKSPNRVDGTYWWDENRSPEKDSEGNDQYDEHHNATVIGHAGYLMCAEGSEAATVDGDALSTEELAKLVFVSFFTMPSDCTFNEFATIMQNVAETFASQGTLTEAQVERVESAFVGVGLYGYDRGIDLTRDATLTVLDVNGEPYDSFTVKLEAVILHAPGNAVEFNESEDTMRTATSTEPLALAFPADGIYRMTVTDAANPSRSEVFSVGVSPAGDDTCEIQTNFGGVDQGFEQAEHTRVVTGEQDISLVLDVSSSMSGSRIEQLRSAAQGFVDTAFEDATSQVRVGMVAYNHEVSVRVPLAVEPGSLESEIASLGASGSTNIELALQTARSQLETGTADRKIIVLMSDGEPTDGAQGDDLIAIADELKDAGFKIYTVGVEQGASGEALLRAMASEGCYYSVDADSLNAFFAQIATEISGVPYMYVRVECPVEVTVSYNGETLSSAGENPSTLASFGSLAFEEVEDADDASRDAAEGADTIKILRLREGVPYTVEIEGTGTGTMDYTIAFVDEHGDYADFRTFGGIDVAEGTKVETVAEYAPETLLEVDEDGDGVVDAAYRAGVNEEAKPVDNGWAPLAVFGACLVAFAALVALRARSLVRVAARHR